MTYPNTENVPGEEGRYLVPDETRNKVALAALRTQFDVDENGCHIWRRSYNSAGRPNWGFGAPGDRAVRLYAYQGAWRDARDWAPIPTGYDLHHTCNVKGCINEEHLELLTKTEHYRRHHPFDLPEEAEIV